MKQNTWADKKVSCLVVRIHTIRIFDAKICTNELNPRIPSNMCTRVASVIVQFVVVRADGDGVLNDRRIEL
jgi:hypothetical protein